VTARTTTRLRYYGSGPDQPGADDDVVLIQDGGLSGSYAVGRAVELDPKTAFLQVDPGGNGLGSVAKLHVCPIHGHVEVA
jgi:hypothetical protein